MENKVFNRTLPNRLLYSRSKYNKRRANAPRIAHNFLQERTLIPQNRAGKRDTHSMAS